MQKLTDTFSGKNLVPAECGV